MARMHEKLYKNSPKLKRDEEDGKMKASKEPSKAEKESSEVNAGIGGMEMHEEGLPAHVRHAHERRDMHNRHETEHAMHDNGKGGHKKEMHNRHEKERADMHKRHEKEHGTEGSGSGKEKISKVEKGE